MYNIHTQKKIIWNIQYNFKRFPLLKKIMIIGESWVKKRVYFPPVTVQI